MMGISYGNAVDAWKESRITIGNVEKSTAMKAASKARKLNAFIGWQDIDEISPCDIEQGLAVLKENGLSGSTLRKVHLHGSQACKYAISHGMASSNPFSLVDRPRANKSKARTLTYEQANQLTLFAMQELRESMDASDASGAACRVAVMLALSTGMRRGEIIALEWSDYDGSAINISRAVKEGGDIGTPKTSSGIRRISLGAEMRDTLDRFKTWQSAIVPPKRWDEPAPIMCDADGSRMPMSSFDHWWVRFRNDAGFPGLKFHELRHTHASLLIGSGVDVKTVQGRLGHSSADITMNIYAHVLPRNDERAANSIDGILFRGES